MCSRARSPGLCTHAHISAQGQGDTAGEYSRSVELSYEDLKHVIKTFGFEFVQESVRCGTTSTSLSDQFLGHFSGISRRYRIRLVNPNTPCGVMCGVRSNFTSLPCPPDELDADWCL